MNRGPVIVHRLTVGLFGLLFLVAGGAALIWHTGWEPITGWVDRLNPAWATNLTAASWWWAVLLGIVVVSLGWGLWLLAVASRPGKVDDLVLAGSGADGIMTVPPKLIASAVADELSAHTMFDAASVKAVDDRGRSLIRIEVTAPSRYSYEEVAAALDPAVEQIRRAVDGADIHVQALVHLQNPS
ncbi:hypothetical protein ABLE92_23435 [Gordonia sp. VNQ95]|uniref:hypothetical protein n=1 Tax=Gordonia sp. VNQ95 TaxID=3156619 RepID=UPI0032B3B236